MAWDPVWEEIFSSQEWGKYPEIELVRTIARNFYKSPDRKAVKILDLGCGPGASSWYLAREGFSVFGIDGSATAIKKLNERLAKEGLGGEFATGDFTRLPYPDSFFDCVVDVEALYSNQTADIKKTIAESLRVLKPGGVLYSQFFGKKTTGFGTGKKIEENSFAELTEGPLEGKGFVHFTDEQEIKELFKDFSSLSIDKVERTADSQASTIQEYIIVARK